MTTDREREFRRLVENRLPVLLRLAYLLTGSPDRAQDVAQEALSRTYGRLGRISDSAALEAYVSKCMMSIVVDGSRRSGLFRRRGHLLSTQVSGDSAELARVDDRDHLQQVLQTLSPLQRACVVLRFYEDLPIAEVADRLGCSPGTVKRETHDGLARARGIVVRDELKRQEDR